MKKVLLIIVGIVVISVGGIAGYLVYDNHQHAVAQAKADKEWNDNGGLDNTSSTPAKAMTIDDVESLMKSQIGKALTPDKAELLLSGFTKQDLGNHQYLFRKSDNSDTHYVNVTFNQDESSVVSVEKH